MTETVRVWVGDLSAYNSGRLVGEWVDGADWEALTAAYDRASHGGQRDYEIMDCEGPKWARDAIGSYGSQATVYAVAVLADELEASHAPAEAFGEIVDCTDMLADYLSEARNIDPDDIYDVTRRAEWVAEEFQDAVSGVYDSREDYAQQAAETYCDLDALPYWLTGAIDWEHAAREMEMGGVNLVELSDGSIVELTL